MELTNENQEETPLLTHGDLAVASFALAETFNSYLMSYNEEDYGDLTKEEMEKSMHRLRLAFIKIDSMLKAMGEGMPTPETEGSDEDQDEETPS